MSKPFPKSWKGEQHNYDELSASGDSSCCVCLSVRSLMMILNVTSAFHWETRYFSPTDAPIDKDLIDKWASQLEDEIVAGLNDCGCGGNDIPLGAMFRLSAAGQVQISTDGGFTYTDAPQYDPRETSVQFPPLQGTPSDTLRCTAANNVVDFISGLVETIDANVFAAGVLIGVVAAALAIFLSEGVLAPLLAGFVAALIELGAAGLEAAFSGDTYDEIRCAVYCNLDEQGKIVDFNQMVQDIADDVTGVAGGLVSQVFAMMGRIGVQNVASTGSGAGDNCTDCGCGCTTGQVYSALLDGWSGGVQTEDGYCGMGLYFGATGGALTFTIPDRDGRMVAGIILDVCDASLDTYPLNVSVEIGGVATSPATQNVRAGGNNFTFMLGTSQDTDTVHIHAVTGGSVFTRGMTVLYDC